MKLLLRRILAIAHKEVIHIVRDKRVVYLALGLPVVMLILFGYAVSLDVDHVKLAVVDLDQTPSSRRLAESFVAGGAFVRVATLDAAEDAEPLFRRGKIKAALVIPKSYERDVGRGEPSPAQLLVDGSDGTTATIALADAFGIASSHAMPEATAGPRVRTLFNPAMRSSYSIVPGVAALILATVSALLSALTIAREWERGSMEQLFATPVGRAEIILGKLVPYAGLGFVQTLLVLTLGSYMFEVPIRGSVIVLFAASTLFLLAMLGLGLFVSVATKSQLVSVQLALTLSMLPATMLSGFLSPIANMPWWLRAVSAAVPARYYMAALRGVMLKGNGLLELAPQLLALAGFATGVVAFAVHRFRRRLE